MKDNIFAYWDYDSVNCKPVRELTTLGAFLVVAGAAFIGFGGVIVIGWMIAVFR